MRKSAGPDGVTNWVIKEFNQQIAGKFSNLINVSQSQGKVPIDLKRSNSVPIYKGGSKEDLLNYRLASLTFNTRTPIWHSCVAHEIY